LASNASRALRDWACERNATTILPLHELTLGEYLDIKRAQALRQQAQPG
jgi:hypothetical protein